MLLQAGARFAEGLLKALGVRQAIVVGHSAGALTAMELFKRCVHLRLLLCTADGRYLPAFCQRTCGVHCHSYSSNCWSHCRVA